MVDDFAKRTMATNAIVLGCTAVLVVVSGIAVSQRRRLMELEKEVDRQEFLRSGEHVGRIKAEKKLRALVTNRMHSEGGLFFAPIAVVHSCFTECVGTPRQGQFAPSTRALLVFDKSFVSPAAFDGVEEFSHLWVFWAFHLNTNMKDTRVHASGRKDSRGHTFPAKVSPPFLKRRVGVFSTRSPHRPNPIGVSLCKVEGVNAAERSIRLSGVDLVDGTPVLDIKPYVPEYDCPRPMGDPAAGTTEENGSDVRVAEWVGASVRHRRDVEWAPEAEAQLKELCNEHRLRGGKGPRMRFFVGDHDGAMRAITESLSVDVRSLRKTREAASAPHCVLLFDGLRVLFAATVTPLSARFPPNMSSSVKPPPSSLAVGTAVEDTTSPKMDAKPGVSNGVSSPVIDFDAGSLARGGSFNSISSWSIQPPSFVETVRVVSVECEEK